MVHKDREKEHKNLDGINIGKHKPAEENVIHAETKVRTNTKIELEDGTRIVDARHTTYPGGGINDPINPKSECNKKHTHNAITNDAESTTAEAEDGEDDLNVCFGAEGDAADVIISTHIPDVYHNRPNTGPIHEDAAENPLPTT